MKILMAGYRNFLTKLVTCFVGPAVKVPGLVFCAGQTATGEIKQATVCHFVPGVSTPLFSDLGSHNIPTENRFTKPQGGPRTCRIVT